MLPCCRVTAVQLARRDAKEENKRHLAFTSCLKLLYSRREGSHVHLRGDPRARGWNATRRALPPSCSTLFNLVRQSLLLCGTKHISHLNYLLTLSTPTTSDEHDHHDTANTYHLTKRLVDPANTLEAMSNRRSGDIEEQEGCRHAAWRERSHRTCSAYSCGDPEMDVLESSDRFVLREGYIRDEGVRAERCVAISCHLRT